MYHETGKRFDACAIARLAVAVMTPGVTAAAWIID
jgi:hypothetical protein